MPIYRITPVDPAASCWSVVAHRGEVLVRARSADRARELTTQALGRIAAGARYSDGHGPVVPSSPWSIPENVRIEVATDTTHPPDGLERVLEPSGHG